MWDWGCTVEKLCGAGLDVPLGHKQIPKCAHLRKGCLGNARGERWDMGNYRWGKELKIKILEWEGII